MLKKRILPCLDINNGRTVKGVNFVDIKDAGDPLELAARYAAEGADELVFLDISATIEQRKTLITLVKEIAATINIPFTVGGGIRSLQDVEAVLLAGADKISINSAAVHQPELISQIAARFGSQCVVVAIDTKKEEEEWKVYINGGRLATAHTTLAWAKETADRGAGEILLTSMNNDGTKAGFALDITETVCQGVTIPVIASGGAGNELHFKELFQKTKASAALAAGIFHYGALSITDLKNYLRTAQISIR
jgi:cyclase